MTTSFALRTVTSGTSCRLNASNCLVRAVARVAAHEIYHILAQTADHDESGVAKASFSANDLMIEGFSFKASSLHRLPRTTVLAAHR